MPPVDWFGFQWTAFGSLSLNLSKDPGAHALMDKAVTRTAPFTHALAAVFCIIVSAWTGVAQGRGGAVHVSGYTRSNGTYVAPHYRSAPDGNFGNNWSTLGNINPYTGKLGTLTSPHQSSGGSYPAPMAVDPLHLLCRSLHQHSRCLGRAEYRPSKMLLDLFLRMRNWITQEQVGSASKAISGLAKRAAQSGSHSMRNSIILAMAGSANAATERTTAPVRLSRCPRMPRWTI